MKVANDILIPELARLIGEGKEVRFTPSGVSMRPFIEGDKDSVILAPVQTPRIGDILLAQVTNTPSPIYVLHRLVRVEGGIYILQGDGNLQGEEHCSRSNVLAKVTAIHSPKGKSKPVTKAWLWRHILPLRRILLKIYRHTCI